MWDWAEGEPDNDLTKNYPFPVPHIRELPSEYRTECCSLHSCSVPANEESLQESSANIEDTDSLQCTVIITNNDGNSQTTCDEDMESGQKNHVNDAELQPAGYVKPICHKNIRYSVHGSRCYGISQFRSLRHVHNSSYAKSIVEEPPDATEEEVTKAQLKLFSQTQM